jgi:hypothetical protein
MGFIVYTTFSFDSGFKLKGRTGSSTMAEGRSMVGGLKELECRFFAHLPRLVSFDPRLVDLVGSPNKVAGIPRAFAKVIGTPRAFIEDFGSPMAFIGQPQQVAIGIPRAVVDPVDFDHPMVIANSPILAIDFEGMVQDLG